MQGCRMYRTVCCVAALSVAMFLGACQSGSERAAESTHAAEQPAITADEVKEKAHEALTATQQYAQQQKEMYQKRMHHKLEHLKTQLEALKSRAGRTDATARQDLRQLQYDVEQKLDIARKKLAEVQSASLETWEAMKDTVDTAIQELQKSYQEFRSHSSDEKRT
ncbi:MAG: hypothetical protein AB7G75_15460 [Candidatus Binatia bacterium]